MASLNKTSKRAKPRKRRATVYDAVNRKVARTGLIAHIHDSKASKKPLRPDEVLFKRKNAPMRYEEDDYYPAHTKLPADQELPSGDLASAMHSYISTLWAKTEHRIPMRRSIMRRTWRGMDETALIALCILMEETARDALGETGDLAFTEAAEEDEAQVLARQNKWIRGGGQTQAVGNEKKQARAGKEKSRVENSAGEGVEMSISSDEEESQDDKEESGEELE